MIFVAIHGIHGFEERKKKPCARAFRVPLHTLKRRKERRGKRNLTTPSPLFPLKFPNFFGQKKSARENRTLGGDIFPQVFFLRFSLLLLLLLSPPTYLSPLFFFFFLRVFFGGKRSLRFFSRNRRNSEGRRMIALIVRPAATQLLLNQQSRGACFSFVRCPPRCNSWQLDLWYGFRQTLHKYLQVFVLIFDPQP